MKSRRLPWLLSALAATAALAAMGESSTPTTAAAIPVALQERMPVIRMLLPRTALPAPAGDPFAPAAGLSTTTEPVPEAIGAVAPPPTFVPLPWRVIGKQQEDGAGWSVFLARGEETWIVREGDTLDEDYRVASIKPPTLILQHLKRKTRSTIDIGDSLE